MKIVLRNDRGTAKWTGEFELLDWDLSTIPTADPNVRGMMYEHSWDNARKNRAIRFIREVGRVGSDGEFFSSLEAEVGQLAILGQEGGRMFVLLGYCAPSYDVADVLGWTGVEVATWGATVGLP